MLASFYPQQDVIESDYIHLPDPDFFNLESEMWEDDECDYEEYEEEEGF